jgi:hypothetical protein
MPECQPFSKAFNWLTLPGIFWFDHPFWVAQFHRNGGSLYSGMVAQYAPDYSIPSPNRPIVRILPIAKVLLTVTISAKSSVYQLADISVTFSKK